MRKYELACIINVELSETELATAIKKITGFVAEEEGKIEKEMATQKRGLKYPIRKKSESFLFSTDFLLNPEKLEHLTKKLKTEAQILRFMVLKKKKKSEAPIRRRKKAVPLKSEKEKTHFAEKNKVDIMEIDKKIDEILSE